MLCVTAVWRDCIYREVDQIVRISEVIALIQHRD